MVVGAGTIVADDPQLTVRRVAGKSPARVAIDPKGRLNCAGKWLAEDGARRFLITAANVAAPPLGAELLSLGAPAGMIPPAAIVEALFAKGLRRILIEGGARTIAAFIEANCLDRLHLLVAPMIIGSGRPGLDLSPIQSLEFALRPHTQAHLLEGGDVLFDCDFSSCRGLPHFSCSVNADSGTIRARSSSALARPYMERLSVFNRLICPSV